MWSRQITVCAMWPNQHLQVVVGWVTDTGSVLERCVTRRMAVTPSKEVRGVSCPHLCDAWRCSALIPSCGASFLPAKTACRLRRCT